MNIKGLRVVAVNDNHVFIQVKKDYLGQIPLSTTSGEYIDCGDFVQTRVNHERFCDIAFHLGDESFE